MAQCSESLFALADWLRGYADTGVELAPAAVETFANLIALGAEDVLKMEKILALAAVLETGAAEDRVESAREAATDPVARAVLDGVETGKVALFPVIPRPVFGDRGGAA